MWNISLKWKSFLLCVSLIIDQLCLEDQHYLEVYQAAIQVVVEGLSCTQAPYGVVATNQSKQKDAEILYLM